MKLSNSQTSLLIGISVILLGGNAFSQVDVTWDGSASGAWNNGNNWSTGSIPSASDNAIFYEAGAGNLNPITTSGANRAINSILLSANASSDVVISINDTGTVDRTLRIATGLTISAGATGNFTITDGGGDDDIAWGSSTTASGTNTVTNNSTSSLLTLAATQKYVGTGSATNTIVYGGAGNITVSGQIFSVSPGTRTLNVTKEGTGTLLLSNTANDYNGTTTITAGTLALSGGGRMGLGNVEVNGVLDISAISSASYTLTSAQTLSGSGTIQAGAKSLIVQGVLAPGSSPGTLTVNGGLTLENTAVSNFEINGTGVGLFDHLSVDGLLTLGGTLNLTTGYSATLGQSVDLFDWVTLSGQFSSITGTSLADGLAWDTSNLYTTGVITVVTAVPEPSVALLLLPAVGVMLLVLRRRPALS